MKAFSTNKIIFYIVIIITLQSCNLDKPKIVGTWNISTFTINGENFYKYKLSSDNLNEAKTIQFLENGFFILTINQTTPDRPNDRYFKFGYTTTLTYKGKWKLNSFSKIEFQFIDETFYIGIQKGRYEISGNTLIIDAKGDTDFSYFNVHK